LNKYLFIFITTLILTVGCSQESGKESTRSKELPSQKTSEFSQGKQHFKVIPFYEEVLKYTEVSNEISDQTGIQIHDDKVMQPFREELAEGNLNLNMDVSQYLTPTRYVQNLKEDSVELLKRQEEINRGIKQALSSSSKLLSGGNKTVFVMPANPELPLEDMNGVAAWTLSDNVILLQINPNFTDKQLTYTVAHEYHHSVNMERNSVGSTILDFVIFEGKADSFAKIVYPETDVQWTKPIPDEMIKDALFELAGKRSSFDYETYNEFMSGNDSKNIPKRANYMIGYKIMQSYLEQNPKSEMEEWTDLDSNEIVQKSEYDYLIKE